jgi:hypothetical protein
VRFLSAKVVLLAHMTGTEYTRNDAFNLGLKIGTPILSLRTSISRLTALLFRVLRRGVYFADVECDAAGAAGAEGDPSRS